MPLSFWWKCYWGKHSVEWVIIVMTNALPRILSHLPIAHSTIIILSWQEHKPYCTTPIGSHVMLCTQLNNNKCNSLLLTYCFAILLYNTLCTTRWYLGLSIYSQETQESGPTKSSENVSIKALVNIFMYNGHQYRMYYIILLMCFMWLLTHQKMVMTNERDCGLGSYVW